MSLDRIFETLLELGLSETDSRVYIVISFKGPLTARSIVDELKITKQQLYHVLKKLSNKKIIEISNSRPALITAVPFETILKQLVNSKINESRNIQEKKDELISKWQTANWNNHK